VKLTARLAELLGILLVLCSIAIVVVLTIVLVSWLWGFV
jgi:hypothetical protein